MAINHVIIYMNTKCSRGRSPQCADNMMMASVGDDHTVRLWGVVQGVGLQNGCSIVDGEADVDGEACGTEEGDEKGKQDGAEVMASSRKRMHTP